eukprot:CAMPEP_0196159112 /NCGR_PEP_ID=MMETSP0910-20130528/46155_1 /TAXON_ID=49265 /ORGANISM="Thalassiosira rotula, Strain GSO102" /LENGTH=143 /DNA_ID=CAMNT_0041424027 /DNA_START=130 /DNA_END=561 /DNA_ORIENTATION=+
MALPFQSGLRGTLRLLQRDTNYNYNDPESTHDFSEEQYGARTEPVASPGPVGEDSSGGMPHASVILSWIIFGVIIGSIACSICACNRAKTNALPRTLVEGDTDVHRAESHPKQNRQVVRMLSSPVTHQLDIPVAVVSMWEKRE